MKKFPRFVIYCLLTPSVGALIFNLYLLISIQFNSESVFAIPDDFLSSVLLPIVGSPLLGLLYFIPALLTYVFAEILLVQVKSKSIRLFLIIVFAAIITLTYTVLILPYSETEFRMFVLLFGAVGAGIAEYLSMNLASDQSNTV